MRVTVGAFTFAFAFAGVGVGVGVGRRCESRAFFAIRSTRAAAHHP